MEILTVCPPHRSNLRQRAKFHQNRSNGSTVAELAGTHSMRSNIGWRHLNSLLWHSVERRASSGLKEREFIFSFDLLRAASLIGRNALTWLWAFNRWRTVVSATWKYDDPRLNMSHEGAARVWHVQPRVVIFPCRTNYRVSYVLSSDRLQ